MPEPEPAHSTGSPEFQDCWNRIGVWGNAECPELKKVAHCRNCPVYSSAAVQLLDRELPPGYLAEWTSHLGRPKEVVQLKKLSALIFRVGPEWLALPTKVLQEVSEVRKIHSLPHRQGRHVLGLVNIRGELLICVSLDAALGLEQAPQQEKALSSLTRRRLLVTEREPSRFAFPVDEVHGIHNFHPQELKQVPSTVSHASATYTKGVLEWDGKSVGLLDEELLFYSLNRSLA